MSADELDEMTKPELLDYARELGVSPANNDMTKEELRAGIDAQLAASDDTVVEEADAEVEQQVTTTMTKDYLARNLVNPTPGTSNATDFLGRSVLAGNVDFLGRALH